jgi:hypothetical protein
MVHPVQLGGVCDDIRPGCYGGGGVSMDVHGRSELHGGRLCDMVIR